MSSFSEKLSRFFSNWTSAADDDYDDDGGRYGDEDMFEEEYNSNDDYVPKSLNEELRRNRRDARNTERRARDGHQPGYRQGGDAAQQNGRQQRGGQYDAQYARSEDGLGLGDYDQGGYARGDYADESYRGSNGDAHAGYDRQGGYGAGDYGQQQYGAYGRNGGGVGGGVGVGGGDGVRANGVSGANPRNGAGVGAGAGAGAGIGAGVGAGAGVSPQASGFGVNGRRGSNNVLPFPNRGTGTGSVIINAKPERYNDAQMICQHLRERHIVVFSLEDMEHEQARRVFDFVSGGVSVLDASIEKHSRMIFSIAPNNVSRMPFKDESNDPGFESFGSGMGATRTRSSGGARGDY